MRNLLARVAAWCVERPAPVLAATALAALVGLVGAVRLEADAGTDQLVDNDSKAYVATQDFKQKFGDDAVVVLVKGDLRQLVLTSDLTKLLSLEGCLAGNAPGGKVITERAGAGSLRPACRAEAGEGGLRPGDVPEPVRDPSGQAARRAIAGGGRAGARGGRPRRAGSAAPGPSKPEQRAAAGAAAGEVITAFRNQLLQIALRYGQTGLPRIDDPTFVSSVVFDSRRPGQPKPRFSYLFPSSDSALISIRLRPELSASERREAIGLIRDAVADPAFAIRDADYVVSGVPVVVEGLADKLSSEIFVLLAAALVVMTITLALIFGPPIRLLPLAIALVAAAVSFGLLAAFGGSLTMASLAVLPILVGLAVDYAIQFQARFGEARAGGSSPARAAVEAAARGGPVIGTAALATGVGFLVLLLSPIPMVRGFGLLLVAGIAIAFVVALSAGLALLSLTPRTTESRSGGRARRLRGRLGGLDALAAAGEARRRSAERIRAIGRRTLAASIAAPGRVLLVALALAIGGWAVGTRTEVISDIRELRARQSPRAPERRRARERDRGLGRGRRHRPRP